MGNARAKSGGFGGERKESVTALQGHILSQALEWLLLPLSVALGPLLGLSQNDRHSAMKPEDAVLVIRKKYSVLFSFCMGNFQLHSEG